MPIPSICHAVSVVREWFMYMHFYLQD
jgi:hypothetical protein